MTKNILKNSLLASKILMPMDIQLFGEGDNPDGGGDPGSDTPGDNGTDENPPGKDKAEKTFTQAQLAAAAKSQTDALKAQHKIELDKVKAAAKAEGRTEAEKFASLTDEQKAELAEKERINGLTEREALLNKRELTATAKDSLVEKGLPISLITLVQTENAEKCAESIKVIEETYLSAVNKGIESGIKERMLQNSRVPGGGSGIKGETKKGTYGETLASKGKETKKTKENPYFKQN